LAKLEANIDGAGFKETNAAVEGEPEVVALARILQEGFDVVFLWAVRGGAS
jgi:hypothetical protein